MLRGSSDNSSVLMLLFKLPFFRNCKTQNFPDFSYYNILIDFVYFPQHIWPESVYPFLYVIVNLFEYKQIKNSIINRLGLFRLSISIFFLFFSQGRAWRIRISIDSSVKKYYPLILLLGTLWDICKYQGRTCHTQ